jgi:LCP family protein required for cell wall assembly
MDCREARRLLEQGVTPGSASAERTKLGFHLSSCPACREYRRQLQDPLLASLMAAAATRPVATAPAQAPEQPAVVAPAEPPAAELPPKETPAAETMVERPAPAQRSAFARALRYAMLGVLAAVGLGVVIILGQAALSIYHIRQNVQAMIVPTPALSVDLPAGVPTLTPIASALPTEADEPAALLPSATTVRPTATIQPTATLPPPTATPSPPPAGEPVNILLLGSDRRPGESEPSRTDAIIVARVDPLRHRVAFLSLPRDLIVEVPGYGSTRINAANVWGEIYGDPDGGIGLARKTVSNLLGIPIDYMIYIDFEGYIGMIDSIGGVTVDVPTELYDPEFPTMDYGYTEAHFLPGPQHFDGATALMYSRIRHPDTDFERMRRQQAVLAGVLGRLREQNAIESLKSLEDMTTALRGYVKTDIPEDRLLGLAWALRDITPDKIERYLVDENMITFGIGDDQWAEVPVPGAIEGLTHQLLGDANP